MEILTVSLGLANAFCGVVSKYATVIAKQRGFYQGSLFVLLMFLFDRFFYIPV
jgi:hypothetical protein